MAHVELSLSESFIPQPRTPTPPERIVDNLTRWVVAAVDAAEPCLVLDSERRVVAASDACRALLGLAPATPLAGRFPLTDAVRLVDFTAARGELAETEVATIPPLLALSSGRLVRGLMRVRAAADGGHDVTLDAISTPVWDAGVVVGSLTFFAPV